MTDDQIAEAMEIASRYLDEWTGIAYTDHGRGLIVVSNNDDGPMLTIQQDDDGSYFVVNLMREEEVYRNVNYTIVHEYCRAAVHMHYLHQRVAE